MRLRVLPFALALMALACGDDDATPPPPIDSGTSDTLGDTASDGTVVDAPDAEGDTNPDGMPDGMPPDGGGECVSDFFIYELGTGFTRSPRRVSISGHASGFEVSWRANDGADNIYVARIDRQSGEEPVVRKVTDDFSVSESPSILSLDTSNSVIAWYDNSSENFEIYARQLSSGAPLALRRITNTAVREDNPTLIYNGVNPLLAWVEDTGASRQIKLQELSAAAAPMGSPTAITSAANSPQRIAMARAGDNVAVAWTDSTSDGTNVLVQMVTSTGTPIGTPTTITSEGNASGSVDITETTAGAALAYGVSIDGVRSEVRFRVIDAAGGIVSGERILTPAPQQGIDASIAQLAGGYVVAYRATREEGLEFPELRILFIDSGGDIIESFPTGLMVEELGGPISIATSGPGYAMAWADVNDSGTTIRAAMFRCLTLSGDET